MKLPKRTILKEKQITSNSSYQLAQMEYNGKTTYSVGKMINGSFYPKTYTDLSAALSDYSTLA